MCLTVKTVADPNKTVGSDCRGVDPSSRCVPFVGLRIRHAELDRGSECFNGIDSADIQDPQKETPPQRGLVVDASLNSGEARSHRPDRS